MALTMEQVIGILSGIEPDYIAIAKRLGAECLPFLGRIVQTREGSLAARATSLACNLNLDQSKEILHLAARNQHVEARIAAAYGVRNMSPE